MVDFNPDSNALSAAAISSNLNVDHAGTDNGDATAGHALDSLDSAYTAQGNSQGTHWTSRDPRHQTRDLASAPAAGAHSGLAPISIHPSCTTAPTFGSTTPLLGRRFQATGWTTPVFGCPEDGTSFCPTADKANGMTGSPLFHGELGSVLHQQPSWTANGNRAFAGRTTVGRYIQDDLPSWTVQVARGEISAGLSTRKDPETAFGGSTTVSSQSHTSHPTGSCSSTAGGGYLATLPGVPRGACSVLPTRPEMTPAEANEHSSTSPVTGRNLFGAYTPICNLSDEPTNPQSNSGDRITTHPRTNRPGVCKTYPRGILKTSSFLPDLPANPECASSQIASENRPHTFCPIHGRVEAMTPVARPVTVQREHRRSSLATSGETGVRRRRGRYRSSSKRRGNKYYSKICKLAGNFWDWSIALGDSGAAVDAVESALSSAVGYWKNSRRVSATLHEKEHITFT